MLERLQIIDPAGSFSCNGCTSCCTQPYSVIVEKEKADALESHDFSNYPQLLGKKFVFDDPNAPDGFLVLAKQEGTSRCIFLAADGLCLIHKELGPQAKPYPCLRFPYNVSHTFVDDRVALDFGCPTVHKSVGKPLSEQQQDIRTICKVAKAGVNNNAFVAIHQNLGLRHDGYDALAEALQQTFNNDRFSTWEAFARALEITTKACHEIATGEAAGRDLVLEKLDTWTSEPDYADEPRRHGTIAGFASARSAPSSVRMLFASNMIRDVVPPDVTTNASLLRRVMMLPKLMPLVKLTGSYRSKLLDRTIDIEAVFTTPRLTLTADADRLLRKYIRTRLWQRHLIGTQLSVVAGIHQHIQDVNCVLFLANSEAQLRGERNLTLPNISHCLSKVELNIANQPRLFGHASLAWFTGQLDDVRLAAESLRLLAPTSPPDAPLPIVDICIPAVFPPGHVQA